MVWLNTGVVVLEFEQEAVSSPRPYLQTAVNAMENMILDSDLSLNLNLTGLDYYTYKYSELEQNNNKNTNFGQSIDGERHII